MIGMEGRVWAEIALDRLIANYRLVKKQTGKAKIMAAIKADAYGHGAIEVANILVEEGVDFFGVASVEEGVELRKGGVDTDILVLSPILYNQIDEIIEHNLMPTISELAFFRELNQRLKTLGTTINAHVEIDTGMTRTGIPYAEAKNAMNSLAASPYIKISGIFTHFPLADADGNFTVRQIRTFSQLVSDIRQKGLRPRFVHMANSSGIFNFTNAYFNLVRPGISLYGLRSSPNVYYGDGFKPVMTLKSKIVNLREVPTNTPISYGHTFRTSRRSRIATVSVGYADGYPRMLSNIGETLCNGRRAKIVGTVCMDLMMIDVTDVPDTGIGDAVTLIGREGKEEITAEECATKCKTIVYEITSGIGPRVARVFKNKNKIVSVRNLLGRWNN
jgi:alanine racemase